MMEFKGGDVMFSPMVRKNTSMKSKTIFLVIPITTNVAAYTRRPTATLDMSFIL
jgi:hypothetical protein